MKYRRLAFLLAGAAQLSAACEPDTDFGIDGVSFGTADEGIQAYALRSTDYSSTSISLLNPDGTMLEEGFLHSGSSPAGLNSALSGDVALPTRSGDGKRLTTLDRMSIDIVTRIDVQSGDVLGQVKTHTPPRQGEDTFSSNPQDYLYVDEDTAWVSRFGVNEGVPSDHIDRGSDLIRIDPTAFERTGDRIDLSAFDGDGTVANPDTGKVSPVAIYARPERIVRVGDHHAVVGLARLSLGYDAIGPGMVALVDLKEQTAEGFDMPGLENCGTVVPVPSDATRVAVSCVGFFRSVPRDGAGLAILRFADDRLELERVWRAKDDAESPITVYGLTALSDRVVLAVAAGKRDSDTPNDRLFRVDLEAAEQTLVLEAGGAYAIGDGVYDVTHRIALIPDGSTDGDGRPTGGVRTFDVDEDLELEEKGLMPVDDVLPVRQIKPL